MYLALDLVRFLFGLLILMNSITLTILADVLRLASAWSIVCVPPILLISHS